VPNGRIAVAYHDFESFSNTGLPEVYLTGETIRTQGFIRRTRCHVVELQEYPGTISYTMMQFLCGVSQGASDMASVRLVFNLSLEDPIRLLRHASNILEPTTREDLNARVEQMIREELASATNTSDLTRGALQLWYHPDVRKAADSVFARLDRLLRQWGIRLTSDSSAYRHYPAVLREMVLQLRAVEQDILSIDNLAQLTPQFSPGDMAKIKNVSKTSGDGSGLFTVIRNKRRNAQVFSDIVGWLDSENASAPLVANLFRELYLNQNAYSRQAIELSELVILSAFERQEMGFEWGETESKTIGA